MLLGRANYYFNKFPNCAALAQNYYLRAYEGGATLSPEEHGRFGSLLIHHNNLKAARHLRLAVKKDPKWRPYLIRSSKIDVKQAYTMARNFFMES